MSGFFIYTPLRAAIYAASRATAATSGFWATALDRLFRAMAVCSAVFRAIQTRSSHLGALAFVSSQALGTQGTDPDLRLGMNKSLPYRMGFVAFSSVLIQPELQRSQTQRPLIGFPP